MAHPVKYLHSGMEGAPVLSNAWGCMTDLLDACLVTGFNSKTAASVVRTSQVATLTISAGHLFQVGQVILVAGADQSAYNGEFLVESVTSNDLTYTVVGTPATPATGTITVKTPPLGFETAFTGTHKRAYRSPNILSNRPYLRVDDALDPVWTTTYSKYAKVTMAQSMTGIDTFVGSRAPYDDALPTKNEVGTGSGSTAYGGWYKWYYAKADNGFSQSSQTDVYDPLTLNRAWAIIGDDRGFYLFNQWSSQQGGIGGHCFTDFDSFRTGDGFNTLLAATDAYVPANSAMGMSNAGPDSGQNFTRTLDFQGKILMTDHTQVGTNVRTGFTSLNTNNTQSISGYTTGVPWPNGPDYSLILHPVYLKQENNHLRGKMPGMMWVHNDSPAFNHGDVITNVAGYPGSKFLMVRTVASAYAQTLAWLAFDLTGPWR